MFLGSCVAYRPSHKTLVKEGFIVNKVLTDRSIFDTYSKKIGGRYLIELNWNYGTNEWAIWTGEKGIPIEYVKFRINSKKEFKTVMETVNIYKSKN